MKTFFLPLKPAILYVFSALAGGIFAGNFCPELSFAKPFWFVLLLIIILIFFPGRIKRLRFFLILSIVFIHGFLQIQSLIYPHHSDNHVTRFLDSEKVIITGQIKSFSKTYKHKSRSILSCQQITIDGKKHKVSGHIHLNLYSKSEEVLQIFDVIEFKSKIKSIHNFENPGAFDYKRYLKLKQVYGNAYTNYKKIKILSSEQSFNYYERFLRTIEQYRQDFYLYVGNHVLNSETSSIITSIVCGKKELITNQTRDLFSKAGISHLLAISGLHLSIIGAMFYFIFYRLLSFNNFMLISGCAKKWAGILTLLPLLAYVLFSGYSPSSQRAFIMAVVFMCSFVFEYETDLFSSLCTAGIIILILDSAALFSISFQLSFTAVFFIISGFKIVYKFNLHQKQGMFGKFLLTMFVTFFAGIGTAPLTAYYFNVTSQVQLFSNIIAIPVIGFTVLPGGLISIAFYKIFPYFTNIVLNLCSSLVFLVIDISVILVKLPFSWSHINNFQIKELLVLYIFVISLFYLIKHMRFKSSCALSCMMVFYICFNSYIESKTDFKQYLKISVLDVGQGLSALIQTRNNKQILVDGGGFSRFSSFDTGRYIVAPYLWKNRIDELDCVILSHPDSDHINGLIYILNNFKVKRVIKNQDANSSISYKQFIEICEKKEIPITITDNEGSELNIDQLKMTFYGLQQERYNSNNNSLVFKLVYQNFTMLFPGDILKKREYSLAKKYNKKLKADVLMSPHHGSITSSSKIFLDKVEPESIIISCGRHNRYGFPHNEISKRYKSLGIQIYRTDKTGAVFIYSDGTDYQIKTHTGG